jgi:hypothetical protein
MFVSKGVPPQNAYDEVSKFLDWNGNQHQPAHRIFAYLIAALGWRVSSGRSPDIGAGILNDFSAVATYAPFVDAMFIDKECASLLQQGRLRSELSYKARIFSMSNKEEFLDYLEELGDSAADDVRQLANDLYGAKR